MQGRVIAGKYELQHEVGAGGMGAVWEAFDQTLRRRVALKLMSPTHADSSAFRQRFEQEAMALAQIRNDHIVAVHDYGIDQDCPYIVMELLAGEDLKARLARERTLAPAAVLTILQQIASGLTAAAAVDIVHRDLKPANIFIARSDAAESVKILDFGVAWSRPEDLDDTFEPVHNLIGTPAYMSPEQIRGIVPHHVSDLWSVGVITYSALTGQLPFAQKTLGELIVGICTDRFVPASAIVPELPPGIDEFFERALAKDASRRFQTARELVEAFAKLLQEATTTKILVVDDEPDMAHLMKMRFRKQIRRSVYQFVFADNGQTALDQLRRHPDTDIVLADINMPVMDGLTLLERIPAVTPFAKVVMVTAYGDMANIRRAMNSGAFDFMVKPIDFQDLEATIEKTVRHVAEHRKMSGSDDENRVLRKFTNVAVLDRLGVSSPAVAFASDEIDASVVFTDMSRIASLVQREPSRATIRMINANFEVIIPEIQTRGGMIDKLSGDALLAMYTGPDHLTRAINACSAISAQLRSLALVAGSSSPYAAGLPMGVASGQVLMGCVGSHVCGRLGYTVIGEPVNEATRLARAARPGEILVSPAIERPPTCPFAFEEAGGRRLSSEVEPVDVFRVLWTSKIEISPDDDESTVSGVEASTVVNRYDVPSAPVAPQEPGPRPARAVSAVNPTVIMVDGARDQDP